MKLKETEALEFIEHLKMTQASMPEKNHTEVTEPTHTEEAIPTGKNTGWFDLPCTIL